MTDGVDWFREAFSDDYIRVYSHRDRVEAASTIDQLQQSLSLPSGVFCLDLCCGFGRHVSVLNARGIDTIGLDLSPALLQHAATLPATAGRIVQGDMRHLPFRQCFDCVFSFFSSFGYFATDAENASVLGEIHRVLVPGGRFAIDFLNAEAVRNELVPQSVTTRDGLTIRQHRRVNSVTNTVEKQLIVEDGTGVRTYDERVKLYRPDDFRKFCVVAGLVIDRFCGDFAGTPFSPQSQRLVVIGRRPA